MSRRSPVDSTPPVVEVKPDVVTIESLAARVEALEKTCRALLIGTSTPSIEGKLLPRCKCRKFVTRVIRFESPYAMTESHAFCDTCDLEHPLKSRPDTKLTESSLFDSQKAVEFARELNQNLTPLTLKVVK